MGTVVPEQEADSCCSLLTYLCVGLRRPHHAAPDQATVAKSAEPGSQSPVFGQKERETGSGKLDGAGRSQRGSRELLPKVLVDSWAPLWLRVFGSDSRQPCTRSEG